MHRVLFLYVRRSSMIYDLSHTIAAIATATGESGVGIIRISGTEAYNIGEKIFRSKGKTRFKDFKDRTIHFGTIVDEKGREIDEALVLIMKRPHSYTAEDILEIQCHGGRQSVSDKIGRASCRERVCQYV